MWPPIPDCAFSTYANQCCTATRLSFRSLSLSLSLALLVGLKYASFQGSVRPNSASLCLICKLCLCFSMGRHSAHTTTTLAIAFTRIPRHFGAKSASRFRIWCIYQHTVFFIHSSIFNGGERGSGGGEGASQLHHSWVK